jgi:hypothetical protein
VGEEQKFDVNELIEVHLSPSDDERYVWVHTHGMAKLGKPELEVRDVPLLFQAAAGHMVNNLADYILNEEAEVKLGHIFSSNPFEMVYLARLEPIGGQEDHYVDDRWALMHPAVAQLDMPLVACPSCSRKVVATLLSREGYAPGEDMEEYFDVLVDQGLLIRMPTPRGEQSQYQPTARGVAVANVETCSNGQ